MPSPNVRHLFWKALLYGAVLALVSGWRMGGGPTMHASPPFAGTAAPGLPAARCPRVLSPSMRNPFGVMVHVTTVAAYQLVGCWLGTLRGKPFIYDEFASHRYGGGLAVAYNGHVVAHVLAGGGGPPVVVRFIGDLACWSEQAGAYFFAINLITGVVLQMPQAGHLCAPPHWPPTYVLGLRGYHYPWGIEIRSTMRGTVGVSCPPKTVCDPKLGVALVLPPHWRKGIRGKYPPDQLTLIIPASSHQPDDVERLNIASWGITTDPNAARVATNGMNRLLHGLNIHVARIWVHYGGALGIMVHGLPGGATVVTGIILVHSGAVYKILAPGVRLAADQRQALASLRFIPRKGRFPLANNVNAR